MILAAGVDVVEVSLERSSRSFGLLLIISCGFTSLTGFALPPCGNAPEVFLRVVIDSSSLLLASGRDFAVD